VNAGYGSALKSKSIEIAHNIGLPGGSKWSPGGPVDQWSQIPITLKKSWIQIHFKVKSWIWIRIRIEGKCWFRIRIKVNSWIRIRIRIKVKS
jgi:hypothetical protein